MIIFLDYFMNILAPRKHRKDDPTSRSKMENNPTSYQDDNIQRFLTCFSNRVIIVKRGLENDWCVFDIDMYF